MNIRVVDQREYLGETEQVVRESLKFSSGLAYGVIIGTIIVWYTASLLNKAAAARRKARALASKPR